MSRSHNFHHCRHFYAWRDIPLSKNENEKRATISVITATYNAANHLLTLVCAGLGSFCFQEGQLSEDKDAYWKEADTFLDRITFALRIKMLLRFPLSYAPLRFKKMVAGDAMLTWVKGKGWE